ncbi:LacI family DNA-binding transcriptional regulator [Microbacterium dauci]|uniref:LacI family DNA-binding transcriptional regulator n=1 Tax=Microbacterium dauci TaxID=3048008 RepID=A0ABT6ZAT1_9MICO|nr:LacI family DNA-binding transcriptional regulator [Microbacterium sp. LX3-4]MDJ1113275.1 LacI family DNA-binding transcriptional regulator [Microbacterium sp. LX3-4]
MTDSPRRRPTLYDVAGAAGVSKSLVSLAIRGQAGVGDATRQRILAVADELGYRSNPWARSLVRGRSGSVGVLVGDLRGYAVDVVHGIEASADRHGVGVVLVDGRGDRDLLARGVERLGGFGVDGIIAVTGQIPVSAVRASAAPVVIVGRPDEVPDSASQVSNDDRLGARMAVHHLLGLGHRRIAHVAGSGRVAARQRASSYEQTMTELGLTPLVLGSVAELIGSDVTAVFCATDRIAAESMGAIIDSGRRVPENLSVVGYDDTQLATWVRPALTTVEQPRHLLGERAYAALAELQDGEPPRREVLPPSLIVRGSTAPVPANAR